MSIVIEKTKVYGWEEAIRGMRNPKNSWGDSDSYVGDWKSNDYEGSPVDDYGNAFILGDKDYHLADVLAKAGTDHGKYLRMITVYADVTAPLYWFKEYDTYKVGTVANSCSTMHKIHENEFTMEDFSIEHLPKGVDAGDLGLYVEDMGCAHYDPTEIYKYFIIPMLNLARKSFIDSGMKDKDSWWTMIQMLPSTYNQKRTVMLNYAVLKNMYHSRKNHKLDEWREFCKWIETLPYHELITEK